MTGRISRQSLYRKMKDMTIGCWSRFGSREDTEREAGKTLADV